MVTLRSALIVIELLVVELLFAGLLSEVVELTVAVFVTMPLAPEGTA